MHRRDRKRKVIRDRRLITIAGMQRFLFWLVRTVPLGPLAAWVMGLALGRWPHRVDVENARESTSRATLRIRYDERRRRNIFRVRCESAEVDRFVRWSDIDRAGRPAELVESEALAAIRAARRLAAGRS